MRRPNQDGNGPPRLLLRNAELKALTKIIVKTSNRVEGVPEIRHCFQRSPAAWIRRRNRQRLPLHSPLNDLFLSLLDLLQQKMYISIRRTRLSQHAVRLFLNDLRDHPEHLAEQWSLADMADSCGLGLTQFVHHVRSLTNIDSARYVAALRFTQAAHLLRGDHAISITDIALTTGFSPASISPLRSPGRFGWYSTRVPMRAQAPSYSCRLDGWAHTTDLCANESTSPGHYVRARAEAQAQEVERRAEQRATGINAAALRANRSRRDLSVRNRVL